MASMIGKGQTGLVVLLTCAGSLWSGCDHPVQLDIQCPRLCLAAPGPTLPGWGQIAPSGFDAAASDAHLLDAEIEDAAGVTVAAAGVPTSIDWDATLRFNDVIAQLPSTTVNVSLEVRLASVTLSGPTDLSFIGGLRVFLSRAQVSPDGGSSATGQSDCWDRISTDPVASYDGPTTSSGPSIELVNLVPDVNLFDCIKDMPAKFLVAMAIQPAGYPTSEVPLTLSTCVGAQTTATYP
jgi:hypothetical protein